jgi:hypothetical protein
MGGGGSSSSSVTSKTNRFAPYIEARHSDFLETVYEQRASLITESPYGEYEALDTDTAFLGAGLALGNFPALYDMFGKYMSGLDVEELWSTTFAQVLEQDGTSTLDAKGDLAEDDLLDGRVQFFVDARQLNIVTSSSFIIRSAQTENAFIKYLAKISLQEKSDLLTASHNESVAKLNWNKSIITAYMLSMKYYFTATTDSVDTNSRKAAEDLLWPFMIFDFERSALGAMQGVVTFVKVTNPRSRSDISKVLYIASTSVQGASLGARIGGGPGAVVGAAIGFIVGTAQMLTE